MDGKEYTSSSDAETFGVVETTVEKDGTPTESTVIVSTGNSEEPAEPANDNPSK